MIATIKPVKIELYINSGKKTLEQVKAETGCQYIINGSSFSTLTLPDCQLKANGKVYVDDGYTYYGYAWDNAADFSMCVVPCKKQNYIALIAMLRNGKDEPMNVKPAYAGSRPRSAIGRNADGQIVLYCTKAGRTPAQVRAEMKAAGCVDALLLDGGESTQCDFNGSRLFSNTNRIVHNFICIWTNNTVQTGNGAKGESDTAILKKGSQGTAVKNLQNQLISIGADISADGDFGAKTDAAVKSFQKDMGLTADGIAGNQTLTALNMAATWKTSGNPLVIRAGQYLGLSEPDGDNKIIDAFNTLAGSKFGYTDAWCQMFAVVCMAETNLNPYITASCTIAFSHYDSIKAVQNLPRAGYLVYFDWDNTNDCDHVGIVAAVGNGYIYVIEGNSGGTGYDAVRIKRYLATDARIRGYVDPTIEDAPTYYIVKLTRAGAEKLAKEYGGEIVKYQ